MNRQEAESEMRWVYKKQNGKWNGQRGSILAVSAIGMVAILLAVGLAVDISHLYLVGTELQNAADASALAAASALNSKASGITEATTRAVNTVNKYEFNGINATIDRANVHFAANLSEFDSGGSGGKTETDPGLDPTTVRFVQVTVPPKLVNIFFATIALGANTVNLTRRAVAGQSVNLNRICPFSPLSVVQDDDDPDDPNDTTLEPLQVVGTCASQYEFTPGCTYIIRLAPGNGVSSGNYLILNIGSSRGGDDVREGLAAGIEGCYTSGETVFTKPGVSAGNVRQGINTRFDDYQGGLSPAEYPPDTNISEGIDPTIGLTYDQYRNNSPFQAPSNTGVQDRRRIILPIINKSEYDQGLNQVKINKFGAFFLRRKVDNGSGGNIIAEYIGDDVTFGDGSFDPNGGPGFQGLTVAVLYR